MAQEKQDDTEKYVFEIYDDINDVSFEYKPTQVSKEYNQVDFEDELNEEQLNIVNNINGPI